MQTEHLNWPDIHWLGKVEENKDMTLTTHVDLAEKAHWSEFKSKLLLKLLATYWTTGPAVAQFCPVLWMGVTKMDYLLIIQTDKNTHLGQKKYSAIG